MQMAPYIYLVTALLSPHLLLANPNHWEICLFLGLQSVTNLLALQSLSVTHAS